MLGTVISEYWDGRGVQRLAAGKKEWGCTRRQLTYGKADAVNSRSEEWCNICVPCDVVWLNGRYNIFKISCNSYICDERVKKCRISRYPTANRTGTNTTASRITYFACAKTAYSTWKYTKTSFPHTPGPNPSASE